MRKKKEYNRGAAATAIEYSPHCEVLEHVGGVFVRSLGAQV